MLSGRLVVSSTERFATFFPDQPLPASTALVVAVDGDLIMGRDGLALDADGDNVPGGMGSAEFRTLSLTRVPGANVFGFVRDSYSGAPIVGATVRVDAFPQANAVTDATGRFDLIDMPSPAFFVHVDGSTATNTPAGMMYPSVGKPFHSVPGQTTQLNMMGVPFDVFLPPMAMGDVQAISAAQDTQVGFGDFGLAQLSSLFPEIDPAVWERVEVTYPAGSAVDDQGNVATQAIVMPVPPTRIPAPLPPTLDARLVISVQAMGATNFDVPARVVFPNLEGLAPGEKASFFSFNHDAGRWDNIGLGTVSADGLMIESDPGVGILAPGWHIATRQQVKLKVSPPCRELDYKDVLKLAKAAGDCIKKFDKMSAIIALYTNVFNSLAQIQQKMTTLRDDYNAGRITKEGVKAGLETIKLIKDPLADAYKAWGNSSHLI